MAETALSRGDTVRAYGAPLEDSDYEGDVVLVRRVDGPPAVGMEWWQCHFVGEAAPHFRLVHARNLVAKAPAAADVTPGYQLQGVLS